MCSYYASVYAYVWKRKRMDGDGDGGGGGGLIHSSTTWVAGISPLNCIVHKFGFQMFLSDFSFFFFFLFQISVG